MLEASGKLQGEKRVVQKYWGIFALVGVILISAPACNYRHLKGNGEEGVSDLSACGPVDYAAVAAKVFSQSCTGCHEPGHAEKNVMLHNYPSVMKDLLRPNGVKDQVESGKMPLGKPLSGEQKTLLLAWIAQGAPEFQPSGTVVTGTCKDSGDGQPTTNTPPETLAASYNSLRANIFDHEHKCTGCHNPNATAGKNRAKYDFSTYQAMIANKNLFDVEHPEESIFVKAITVGPILMPPRGPHLSEEEVTTITEWIKLGLPETVGGPPGIIASKKEGGETDSSTKPTDPVVQPPPAVQPPPSQACEPPLDFAVINSLIIQKICNDCHGLFVMPAFDSYADVKANLRDIEFDVRSDKMPQKGPHLATDLKDKLFAWIKAGAPEHLEPAADAGNCQQPKGVTP